MKQMQIVPPNYIHQVWDKIESYFDRAMLAGTDDYNVDQLKMLLTEGRQTLFVFIEDEAIIGALAVELINFPNHRIAHTSAVGGKGIFDENTIKQYEDWCRAQNATKIRAFAKDAQARLYKMKMGFDLVTHVVEKKL
jgi:hypothetical protein